MPWRKPYWFKFSTILPPSGPSTKWFQNSLVIMSCVVLDACLSVVIFSFCDVCQPVPYAEVCEPVPTLSVCHGKNESAWCVASCVVDFLDFVFTSVIHVGIYNFWLIIKVHCGLHLVLASNSLRSYMLLLQARKNVLVCVYSFVTCRFSLMYTVWWSVKSILYRPWSLY
jgi:hypothetical protein